MNWNQAIRQFRNYMKLERSLSGNSVNAYVRDIQKLHQFIELSNPELKPEDIKQKNLEEFLQYITELQLNARSQSRVISGIKSFYKYILLEDIVESNPSALIESPKISMKLPEVLDIEEIDKIEAAIDLSRPEGQRNKAIIETLYSCGLRVSELINLKLSNLYFEEGFIKVIGKGNKERLVPLNNKVMKEINFYLQDRRKLPSIAKEAENVLYLNRRGKGLTRVMIFTIVKQLVKKAGIKKNISPHTFRHSFASHLVDGGADLRAVQEMLGHESIITTEIYTHLDNDYLRSAIIQYHPREKS